MRKFSFFMVFLCIFSSANSQMEAMRVLLEGPRITPTPSPTTFQTDAPDLFELPGLCGFNGPNCSMDEIYRRYDGSCSNSFFPDWGFVGSRYLYLLPPVFEDGVSAPRIQFKGKLLPETRVVKNKLFPDGNALNDKYTIGVMSWGQIWAHDLSLLNEFNDGHPCCTADGKHQKNTTDSCFGINVPADDPFYSPLGVDCLNFSRILTDHILGCTKPTTAAKAINTVTPALDASFMYSNNVFDNTNLRTFLNGQMRMDVRNNISYPPTAFIQGSCSVLYETGDFRSNQNAPLLLLHTAFLNNHNAIAKKLSILNKHWGDDTVYEETRRIMIAFFQKITYYDWIPLLFGHEIPTLYGLIYDSPGYINDFDPSVHLGATNENSQAASRVLHTLIPETIEMYNENRVLVSSVLMSENFFCQELFENPEKIKQLIMGLITQRMGDMDELFPISIAENLFKVKNGSFGGDLRSTDIQRSRDVALAPYIEYAQVCGVVDATNSTRNFDELRGIFSDDVIKKLSETYGSVEAIDLYTGLSLELLVNGTILGPTTVCILADQFLRSRVGDEKWFEHVECNMSEDQINAIKAVSYSKFLCNGLGINEIQENAFLVPSTSNPIKKCSELPGLNLKFWTE